MIICLLAYNLKNITISIRNRRLNEMQQTLMRNPHPTPPVKHWKALFADADDSEITNASDQKLNTTLDISSFLQTEIPY